MGDDVFSAAQFNKSVVFGQNGNDYLSVGIRTSQARGGWGDDTLIGKMSHGATQTFTGDQDDDSFIFESASTNNEYHGIITDYEIGELLKVDGHEISGLRRAQLPSGFTFGHDEDGSLEFSYVANGGTAVHTITLVGISAGDFFG